jgi:CubicO group peptidase (beta-lactamase class C family)
VTPTSTRSGRITSSIDPWLPELANRRVLSSPDAALDDTVPADRPITVRDLLTLRSGLGMSLRAPTTPFEKATAELQLVGFGPPMPSSRLTPDEWLAGLGTLPLIHQPGARWMYNTASSITGVLIARASGMPSVANASSTHSECTTRRSTSHQRS